MHRQKLLASIVLALLLVLLGFVVITRHRPEDARVVSYRVDLDKQSLKLYWKDDHGQPFRSLQNLKSQLAQGGNNLAFAMNAGMYKAGNYPLGLFIADHEIVVPLDTMSGIGNFYLKPNGVFYTTTKNEAGVCRTEDFIYNSTIAYATQSGPMLVINARIHPAFKPGSENLNVRNGVGILPNGQVLFAMSKEEMSLYDFANYFRRQGCQNALYLDGLVSRTYLPEKNWVQTGGDFGVIIGVTAR